MLSNLPALEKKITAVLASRPECFITHPAELAVLKSMSPGELEKFAIEHGWNHRPSGTPPWAAVLLDLCFYTGPVTPESNTTIPGMPEGCERDEDPAQGDESCRQAEEHQTAGEHEYADLVVAQASRGPGRRRRRARP